jgi:hypothetical protein
MRMSKPRIPENLPEDWELDWDQLPVEALSTLLVTVRIEGGVLVMNSGLPDKVLS